MDPRRMFLAVFGSLFHLMYTDGERHRFSLFRRCHDNRMHPLKLPRATLRPAQLAHGNLVSFSNIHASDGTVVVEAIVRGVPVRSIIGIITCFLPIPLALKA